MSKNSPANYITVFVPTFNGEKYIGEVIRSILGQELPNNYSLELLVIDSGSKDGTMKILRSFKDKIKLLQIPNSDFGHGKTRQYAAKIAKGKYILYLTQDATPASNRWIINMIEPFLLNEKVGIVFGRQIPRPLSVPTIKREVAGVFAGIGSPDSITIQRSKSLIDGKTTNEVNDFFSDVNSAIRRKILTTAVPFRDISYSEDQALAQDMNKAGYLKAYSALGAVWHSNEYSASDFMTRKYEEYKGLQNSIGYVVPSSSIKMLTRWIKPTLADWKFTLQDSEYPRRTKIKYLFLSPLYNISVSRAIHLAFKDRTIS